MTETASTSTDSRRARLRSDIRLSARVLPTHYPLSTFIAVNPLAGLQDMPFEQAIRRAGDLYGTPGTLPESTFRSLYRRGRITDTDLDKALLRRYPILAEEPDLRLAERTLTATDLLRADLLHGQPCPDPIRRYRLRAEELAPDVADTVDALTSKWSAAFLGHASWPMPGRELGFYAAWRTLAPGDRTLPRSARAALRCVAERPDDAALQALDALGVDDDARITYLQAHLTRLPGWAAHVQWCGDRGVGIDLLQYQAMRLSYEAALMQDHNWQGATAPPGQATPTARQRVEHLLRVWGITEATDNEIVTAARILSAAPVPVRVIVWQSAFEDHYRDQLLGKLQSHRPPASPPAHTHFVTCIDTRSEGLRRRLEACGGYQTFGFAGFFAVAIRFSDLLGGEPADLCPVLIAPRHHVAEQPAPRANSEAARQVTGTRDLAGVESAFHAAKESLAAPYVLAEAAGWIAAPLSVAKTLTPTAVGNLRRTLRNAIAPSAKTQLNVESMSLAERVLFAQVTLKTIGLTAEFGRLIVLCGHHSVTENNPYQASLDCGACGGQGGGPNARTAALILNQADVRSELRSMGIAIPEHTRVVAALHDTATDRVTVLDTHLIPPQPPRRYRPSRSRPRPRRPCPGRRTLHHTARRPQHVTARRGTTRRTPIGGLGPGLPRMGAGGKRRIHHRAKGTDPRHRPTTTHLPALLRRRHRPRRHCTGNDPHRATRGGSMDQLPVLLLHRRPRCIRRRHQDCAQRRRKRRSRRRPRRRLTPGPSVAVGRTSGPPCARAATVTRDRAGTS